MIHLRARINMTACGRQRSPSGLALSPDLCLVTCKTCRGTHLFAQKQRQAARKVLDAGMRRATRSLLEDMAYERTYRASKPHHRGPVPPMAGRQGVQA